MFNQKEKQKKESDIIVILISLGAVLYFAHGVISSL